MKTIATILFTALIATFGVSRAAAAESPKSKVHAILIVASSQKGEADPKLAAYEPTLKRILRFESYKLAGEGTATPTVPGKASIALARGHSLELDTEKADGGVRVTVKWLENGKTLMNTGITARPGVPSVLGGPSTGKEGEVWAVILIVD